jgi:hypothetical protein
MLQPFLARPVDGADASQFVQFLLEFECVHLLECPHDVFAANPHYASP